MCGITGIYNFKVRPIPGETLAGMTDLLYHRGPDDYGYAFFNGAGQCAWCDQSLPVEEQPYQLALGHRRLSIIDLSPTGHQPMTDVSGQVWITYNGEIYNYIELRRELQQHGYRFRGTCDTEVILNAWRHWGADCQKHFNGMWAFVLWDSTTRTLFCSRDRVGIKPFYYYLDDESFIFGSEIKAVLAGLDHEQIVINEPYLSRFIRYGLKDDSSQTCFKNVRQLEPGHCLEIKNGRVDVRRYWGFTPGAEKPVSETDIEALTEQFRDLLEDSVRLRMRADVPVGVCLSGGLDSSSVAAFSAKSSPNPVYSFTAEYPQAEFAEGHYARMAAQAYHTNAHYITPESGSFPGFIEQFTWVHDEPCPGPGPFSQWHVMKLAAGHVKVLLEGQGADELLGGYMQYFDYYLADRLRDAIHPGRRYSMIDYMRALRSISQLNGVTSGRRMLNSVKLLVRDTLPGLAKNAAGISRFSTGIFRHRNDFDRILHGDFGREIEPISPWPPSRGAGLLNNVLYRELTRDNLPMLLNYDDRTSMAFSLESRVPFVDYRLIEFMSALPGEIKIRGDQTKYLLRRAMKGILPDAIVNRSDKKGFPTPFTYWLKDELRSYTLDVLHSRAFQNRHIFDAGKVNTLYRNHCSGQGDHAWLLWRVLNVEMWQRLFFDQFESRRQVGRQNPERIDASSLLTAEKELVSTGITQ